MKTGWRWAGALALALTWTGPLPAQGPGQQQQQQQRLINPAEDPLLAGFRWREIGPIGQGGRVDDIAVAPDTRTYYVAFATAGVWKTENNGVTFEPIFETYTTSSVGAVEVAPSNPNVVYVGTGEANN